MTDDRRIVPFMHDKLLPFGKYKGHPIGEVLDRDPSYLEWLSAQDWFRTQHVILHQTIINHGAQPGDTPDHNRLQALFLDEAFCLKFLMRSSSFRTWFERPRIWAREPECHRRVGTITWTERVDVPEHYDENIKITEPGMYERLGFHVRADFEVQGVDVELYAHFDTRRQENGVWIPDAPHCYNRVSIEVKPTVGDDYPTVLRQMQNNNSRVLFLETYTGIGATEEQFVEIFQRSGRSVVFRRNVDQTRISQTEA